ncbi:hypothetical protein CCH79_00016953 [Gambusia affinis]|uniref:phosphoinositide phospholipase C n=1 Tax=Gambusia affinis TaxID=33528 RepID=A0A315VHQ1_GAMAF|nr:hypothetical protein CCH79_00016953 [Gambusia affinis]
MTTRCCLYNRENPISISKALMTLEIQRLSGSIWPDRDLKRSGKSKRVVLSAAPPQHNLGVAGLPRLAGLPPESVYYQESRVPRTGLDHCTKTKPDRFHDTYTLRLQISPANRLRRKRTRKQRLGPYRGLHAHSPGIITSDYCSRLFWQAQGQTIKGWCEQKQLCPFQLGNSYSVMLKKNKVPLSRRVEILSLFQRYTEGLSTLPASALLMFLCKEQMELTANKDTAEDLIDRYEIEETAVESRCMTFEGFLRFMESKDCCVFNRSHKTVYQDMDQPLTSYFISTSHNTYLTGDQLVGKSHLDAYVSRSRPCRAVSDSVQKPSVSEHCPSRFTDLLMC